MTGHYMLLVMLGLMLGPVLSLDEEGTRDFAVEAKLPEMFQDMKRRYRFSQPQLSEFLRLMGRLLVLNSTQITSGIPHQTTPECPESFNPNIECDFLAKYRTFDGSCNNVMNPLQGRANTPFVRLLPNAYADGLKEPRVDSDGNDLPNARLVSRTIHTDENKPSSVLDIAVMTFGQILDHDTDLTAPTKLPNPSDPSKPLDVTCGEDNCGHDDSNMEECFPIRVPEGDSCFNNTECLQFVRSRAVVELGCPGDLSTLPRQHLNTITAYLDCSFVYGSSEEEARSLREDNNSGRLLLSGNPLNHAGKPLLPPVDSNACEEPNVNESVKCMRAGDGRVNEWIGLTSFHIVFAREHNRIADELARINPEWLNESDRVYQEARRILIALWQRIVYKEYLPVVMGSHFERYNLALLKNFNKGYFSGYDENRNAQAANVFAGAAFRFGHSQIDKFISFIRDNKYMHVSNDEITLHQNRPAALYGTGNQGVDAVLRGQVHLPSQNTDAHFTEQMSCHMFTKDPPFGEGQDLPSLNIQRGRDHGFPGYNAWRQYCNLPSIANWDDKPDELSEEVWTKMRNIYKDVDDIDLFPAGVSEQRVKFGAVGPTFACLLGEQFEAFRVGDRHWHEIMGPGMFCPDQLKAIDKGATLARIICDASDDIQFMQPMALLLPQSEIPESNSYDVKEEIKFLYGGKKNERVHCSKLPTLDLSAWKDM